MMEKTKLGIPVTLMAAIVCLLSYYGGYIIAGILVGYVLLMEENVSLKRLAVKVMALLLTFSLLSTVIYLIPNILSLIRSLIYIFDEYAYTEEFYNNGFNRFIEFLSSLLSLLKTVLFLLMSGFAVSGKELKVPVLDKFLDKYLTKQEA